MRVRQFVRQNAGKPRALLPTQRRRQEDAPRAGHGGDGGVFESVRTRVILVYPDSLRIRENFLAFCG